MKRIMVKLFAWREKTTQQQRPSLSGRLALEQMEARELPVVGAYAIPPIVTAGTGLDGVVRLHVDGGFAGTGTLLSDGRHILTAAHVLTRGADHVSVPNIGVEFELPSGSIFFTVPAANLHLHPGWEGESIVFAPDDDLAIIELPSLAPFGAERRDIYRGTDEVGRTMQLVGYGDTGTGEEGAITGSGEDKRQGLNVFDTTDDNKLEYLFLENPNVVFPANGDSGGPALLDGRIAGVNMFVRDNIGGWDPEFQFGERAFSVRASAYADWIDEFTTGSHPLIINMHHQPDGNDGVRDRIDVRVIGGNLEVRVNNQIYHLESAANVTSLSLVGSNDSEVFVTSGLLGMDVSINAGLGTQSPGQSLTVLGTSGPDSVTVGPNAVTFGGHTIAFSFSGVGGTELSVHTLAGNDIITHDSAAAIPTHFSGGSDSDTLIGSNTNNLWLLAGTNAGTLNSLVSFNEVENLKGGSAADTFAFGPGNLSGTVNGGAGGGTLDYRAFAGPVTVNLQSSTAPAIGSGFSNITSVVGSNLNDTLIGRNLSSVWTLTGLNAGQISGSGQGALSFSGFENLSGGTAPDTFTLFNAGAVTGALNGGSGFVLPAGTPSVDSLDFSHRSAGVVVDMARGSIPGAGQAIGIEQVIGSSKNDLLRGDGRDNILHGGGGFDILVGGDGNDELIAGNTGSCILIGGRGVDRLMGGNPPVDPQTGTPLFNGSDLLIGGLTRYDDEDQALLALMNGWRGRGRSYAQRVQDLRTGVLTDSGALVQLTTTTVLDDGDADRILGRGGDDWFWGLASEVGDWARETSEAGVPEFLN